MSDKRESNESSSKVLKHLYEMFFNNISNTDVKNETKNSLRIENSNSSKRDIIHFDPVTIFYSVTERELEFLTKPGGNKWKDYALLFLGIFIPALVNSITYFFETNYMGVFINLLAALVSLICFIIFAIEWNKCKSFQKELLDKIKSRKEHDLIV